jgi:hypothetical protein
MPSTMAEYRIRAYPIDGGQSSYCIFFETMSENECRGEPYVRPRTETDIEPMPEGERFIYILDQRSDTGFCSRANTRFDPTFDLEHRFDSGFCFPHPSDTPIIDKGLKSIFRSHQKHENNAYIIHMIKLLESDSHCESKTFITNKI